MTHTQIEELNRLNKDLQREIAARKKAETETRTAREAADEAAQTKSDFLANISHELRTPMHGILSFSRFGMQKVDDAPREKLANYFEQINTSATRLMLLLNDLLDLSKHSEAKFEYQFSPHSIQDILNGVVLEFNASIREKELNIKYKNTSPSTTVECDQGKIRQVLSNLLINAIKYSRNGELLSFSFEPSKIEIDGRKQSALRVSLADQGIGIPEQEIQNVFEKFFQSSRTRMGAGGTGLGLAICKEIITAHHGSISASSNPAGTGAVFSFTIPKKQASTPVKDTKS